MRPIVASMGIPTEHLSAYITNILTNAYDCNNEYFVKDSFQISQILNKMKLPSDYVLASLDVISLFSNVYLEITLKSIEKNWERIRLYCDINKNTFLEIITYLFNNTFFTFDNKYYKQTFGTPMGANISPILATYVMDELLNSVIPLLSFRLL